MKKIISKAMAYFLVTVIIISLTLTNNDIASYAASKKYVKSLSVKSSVSIERGKKTSVTAKVKVVGKADKKLSLKSSNSKVAKVSYNSKSNKITIKGVKEGKTNITVTTKGKNKKGKKISKTIKVTVKKKKSSETITEKQNTTEKQTTTENTEKSTQSDKSDNSSEKPAENPQKEEPPKEDPQVFVSNDGKVLNIFCWNEEFARRLADHYPGFVKNDADDVLQGGKIGDITVKFTAVPSDNNAYQNTLDEKIVNNIKAKADEKIDIFLMESDYTSKYINSNNAVPLSSLGIKDNELSEQYAFTKAVVTDDSGYLKGTTWQVCPGVLVYNRVIAKEILGTDDPTEVQKQLSDWDKYEKISEKMSEAGYKMTATTNDTYRVFYDNRKASWVNNGTLTVDDNLKKWAVMSKKQVASNTCSTGDLWGTEWYDGFYPDGKVFCYFGPEWLIDFSMAADDKDSIAANGDWGACEGPAGFNWGGTWLSAANGTDNSELVADIFRKLTMDSDIMKDIAIDDNDFVNNMSVMDSLSTNNKFNNDILGGQNPLSLFSYNAKRISGVRESGNQFEYSEKYQDIMNDYFDGIYDTYEDAEKDFIQLSIGTIKDIDVKSIKLSDTELTLGKNANYMLDCTILPRLATDKNVTWTTSDENIATVNEYGYVTAVGEGKAVITVTHNKTKLSAKCNVEVINTGFMAKAKLDSISVKSGSDVTMEVIASANEGIDISYLWAIKIWDGFDENGYELNHYEPIEGATGNTYTLQNVTQRMIYYCYVSSSKGDSKYVEFDVYPTDYPLNLIPLDETQQFFSEDNRIIRVEMKADGTKGILKTKWMHNSEIIEGSQDGNIYSLIINEGGRYTFYAWYEDEEDGEALCDESIVSYNIVDLSKIQNLPDNNVYSLKNQETKLFKIDGSKLTDEKLTLMAEGIDDQEFDVYITLYDSEYDVIYDDINLYSYNNHSKYSPVNLDNDKIYYMELKNWYNEGDEEFKLMFVPYND